MKKEVFYAAGISRPDVVKQVTSEVFMQICSWPRLLLEVFSRKNLGVRYMNMLTAVLLIIGLSLLPLFITLGYRLLGGGFHSATLSTDFYFRYATWYLYLGIYFIVCLKRKNEISRRPSVFDFSQYTKSAGVIQPFIRNIKWKGKVVDIRTFETIIEPSLFFIIGLALWVFKQNVGMLIMICSFFYSMSYFAAYHKGDEFIMDKIDETICKQDIGYTMLEGREPSEERGLRFYGTLPIDPANRKLLAESFFEEDEAVEVR